MILVTCLQPLNAFIRPHAPKANPPNPAAAEAINGADAEAVRKMDIVSLGADGKPVFRNWLDLHHILHPGGHATHGTEADHANTTLVFRLLWEVRWLLVVLILGTATMLRHAPPAAGRRVTLSLSHTTKYSLSLLYLSLPPHRPSLFSAGTRDAATLPSSWRSLPFTSASGSSRRTPL